MSEQQVQRKIRRRTSKGSKTRESVLDGTTRVLSKLGVEGFSIPNVAAEVGIAQGNLTYYFPLREDLIAALSERVLEVREHRLNKFCEKLVTGDANELGELVDWLLEDAVSVSAARFFPQLWALAGQHDCVAECVDRIQDGTANALLRALGGAGDRVSAQEVRSCADLLSCIAGGATISLGRLGAENPRFLAMKKMARRVIVDMLQEAVTRGCHRASSDDSRRSGFSQDGSDAPLLGDSGESRTVSRAL